MLQTDRPSQSTVRALCNERRAKTKIQLDPEDDALIYEVANLSREDIKSAINASHKAFLAYKKLTHRKRKALLREWTEIIRANRDDLAAVCTLELGKPIAESYTTVDYGISFLDWFEGEIERLYGDTIPAAKPDARILTTREPQGVVAAITPWNSPIAMILRKVGAAIAAGNSVVLKPAPETPMCAIAIAKLFERVKGFPPGTLNIVTGDAKASSEIGDELCHNRLVRHLSFTGSTAVGKFLNSECAKSLKRTSMELGGNAPFIVFGDADVQKAVDGELSNARLTCHGRLTSLSQDSLLPNSVLRGKHAFAQTAPSFTTRSLTNLLRCCRRLLKRFSSMAPCGILQ